MPDAVGPLTLAADQALHRLINRPPRTIELADARLAAVAAIFRTSRQGVELLFIRRAASETDPWSAQVGFPGGRFEPSDVDLLATAIRETKEEIGLDLPSSSTALGPLDDLQARARKRILPMIVRPYAFLLDDGPAVLGVSEEVAGHFWMPLAELANPGRFRWYEADRGGYGHRFRAIEVGSEPPLWGLTHRMVGEILARVGLIEDVDAFTLPERS